MRRLLKLALIVAFLWGAWWWTASVVMERAIVDWFEDRRAAGWQADVDEITQMGFPLRLHTRLRDLRVVDPETGVAVALPTLDLVPRAYWPGFVSVHLPQDTIAFTTPGGPLTAEIDAGQADLRLRPGPSLQLQSMGIIAGAWTIAGDGGTTLSADDIALIVAQAPQDAATYQLNVDATNLTPGSPLRATFSVPERWPGAFEVFGAEVVMTFDAPWDRLALSQSRPQPRAIILNDVAAKWGAIEFSARGSLIMDATGVPTGNIALRVANWRQMLNMMDAGGALSGGQRFQTELTLGALSNLDGNLENLDLTLVFADGDMALGPILLGPAPRLILP